MTNKFKFVNEKKLNELTSLLHEGLQIYRDDRERAIKHYNDLKDQLKVILDGEWEMSSEAKLESECNKALKLVFDASKRYDEVIKQVTQVIISQLNNESREKVAKSLGSQFPNKPVDFNKLRNNNTQEIDYEEDEN